MSESGVPFLKFTVTIKRNHEFQRLYHKGKSAATPYLALYCRKNRRMENRLGLTVGKKVEYNISNMVVCFFPNGQYYGGLLCPTEMLTN